MSEILRRAAEIRAEWDDKTERERRIGPMARREWSLPRPRQSKRDVDPSD